MNETISMLLRHRSIRKFTSDPITNDQLSAILDAAQHASTSSNMQAYSIVGVTDANLKQQLVPLAGNQACIADCPLFLVWCADLNRFEQAARRHYDGDMPSTVENFITSTVDAALAAQNATVAAESLGLGVVYIGGIRNSPKEVSGLLQLPKHVYPVFGMCLGVPDQDPIFRPRIPRNAVYHENVYSEEHFDTAIDDYDQAIQDYMIARTKGGLSSTWSQEMAAKAERSRKHMRGFLQEQGFELQ